MARAFGVIVLLPQGFFRSQGGNGLEHSSLFFPKMRKGRYLLEEFAGNCVSFSGICVSFSDAPKVGDIFNPLDIPMLLTDTKGIHRAMNDGHHEITLKRIRHKWFERTVNLKHLQEIGNRSIIHGFKLPVGGMRKYPFGFAFRHSLRHWECTSKKDIQCLRVVMVMVCNFRNGNALIAVTKGKEIAA